MWEQIKPLLLDLYQIACKTGVFFRDAFIWLFRAVIATAAWLYGTVYLYFRILGDLTSNHRSAVIIILVVLIIGYFIVDQLQKKKSFTPKS